MRTLLCVLWMAIASSSNAQFDLGGSVGASLPKIHSGGSDGHGSASFRDVDSPAWTASVFYRERKGTHTNLGLELIWYRQEFHCSYSSGGLAWGTGSESDVVLHTLNLAILPEVRLGELSEAVIRFGLLGGFRIAGSKTGSSYSSIPYASVREEFENSTATEFGGDMRVVLGFGFKIPSGEESAITLDPYGAYGISSMLKTDPGSRTTEFGIRVGWSRRMDKGTLTGWIDRITPTPPPGPNW